MNLGDKIDTKTAKIGIIGLGYVGLPLAVEFAKAGFETVGFETNTTKVVDVMDGKSYIPDVPSSEVVELVKSGKLRATTHQGVIGDMDAIIICVPTPLKKTKDPDIQYILAACESVAKYMHAGMLISLESSTYPGTTDELMLPMFERGYTVGTDFFLCFSPERVDPGNSKWQTRNIPKVIGGITPECTAMGERLYKHAVDDVVCVDGTRTAEMVKLLENTFRMVNIGLVNELAIQCNRMGINIWNVIDAAKTKPFGFMPFYPGPGLGGHCIPIDPFYFTWKAKQYGLEPRLIETAGYINSQMPHYVVSRIQDALNMDRIALNGSCVHLLGLTYKRDIDDVRESPAIDVAHLLLEKGADLSYYDPYVPYSTINGKNYTSFECVVNPWADCVVVLADHSCVDYQLVYEDCKKHGATLVDTRNVLPYLTDPRIVRL